MKTLLTCYRSLLIDVSRLSKVPLGTPDELDMNWILIEGPGLDKVLLRYLEEGLEQPEFPKWLTPLWSQFRLTGEPVLLRYLRQLLCFGYKTRTEPTNEQLNRAQALYEEVDGCITIFDTAFNSCLKEKVMFRSARTLISRVIARIDWRKIVPSHGPGAVYPPMAPYERSRFSFPDDDLEEIYPYYENFRCVPAYWPTASEASNLGVYSSSIYTAKLVAVPKDSRGPRLISVHHAALIWLQQGQRKLLEDAIARSQAGPFINLKDQSVNGALALASSIDQEYCTLDLKDASDRISCTLVRYLFGSASKYLFATRARSIVLMDGREITLNKFAPMGNCLTFPVQSLLFWALVKSCIASKYGSSNHANVYVFGDDIIFPSKYHACVVSGLTAAGLVVNAGKTFYKGFFRESCGVDAYKGTNITPTRVKTWGDRYVSYADAVSMCAIAKSFRLQGYWDTSCAIYAHISRFMALPLSNDPHATAIYEYVDASREMMYRWEPRLKWHKGLHKYIVAAVLPKPTVMEGFAHDWYHVQDSLLRLERGESSVSSRPQSLRCPDPARDWDTNDREVISDRGTVYTVPYRERFVKGWIDAIVK